MNETEKQEIIGELKGFYEQLKSYKKRLESDKQASKAQRRYTESLREKLVRKTSILKGLITELTQKQYYTQFREVHDIWNAGLNPSGYLGEKLTALGYCIDATNEAIAKLESTPVAELELQKTRVTEYPKAFIVHGGRSGVLEKLREFVEALGIKPLIVEMLPSKGMTLADKVKKYQQEADCAIILATRGGIIDTKSGKQHPRLNVIDELSSFHEAFPEKVIVLLEKGAELPSNKAGLTYEPFARQSMDRAFIAIARELTEMKILKAVKPKE